MPFKPRHTIIVVNALVLLAAASPSMGAKMQISAVPDGVVGHPATVTVAVENLDFDISGFNLLLAVDQSSYVAYRVTPGQFFEDCEWEYFTYRIIHDSAQYYNLGDYTDLLNVTAFASVTSGYTPLCYGSGVTYDLVQIECQLGLPYPGRRLECEWLPIRFYWRDCSDNVLYSRNNDTVYTAAELFEYGIPAPIPVTYPFPGFGIPDPPCPDPPGQAAVSSLVLQNGGIDVVCPTNLCGGDVNLDGFYFEVGDAVLFTNYFIWGMSVFTINPEAQVAQTDIDCDGITLEFSDLTLMIRTVAGDTLPMFGNPKGFPQTTIYLTASKEGTVWTLNAGGDIGGVYMRFVGENGQALTSSNVTFFGPAFTMGHIGDTTTMLLMDIQAQPILPSGVHRLFEFDNTDLRLVEIHVVGMDGSPFKVEYSEATLPTDLTLQQSYPNPFNPSTTVDFYLPVRAEWTLSIYNVAGQLVRQFNGNDRGAVEVRWDGRDSHGNEVASGAYLYRLQSGENSAVRKMMLLR